MSDGVESDVVTPTLPGMVVKHYGVDPKMRQVFHFRGISAGKKVIVHNSSIRNLTVGVAERVLFLKSPVGDYGKTPKPQAGVVNARLGEFRRLLAYRLRSTARIGGVYYPIKLEEYPSLYTGRKQKTYQRAVESLDTRPVERRDSDVKTFVKGEKAGAVPRIIQPPDPRYNASLGVYLKPIEHVVFNAIKEVWHERVVAKGLNALQRGKLIAKKWAGYHNPVAVGLDAKRFDQHVSLSMLRDFEHPVYKEAFRDPHLAMLLDWRLRTKGTGYCKDGHLKYTVEGCRMSGDINTSLGNCLIMCAMVWTYVKTHGIPCSFINDGDDCVVFMERHYLQRFMLGLDQWFLELGFQMTAEDPVDTLERVEFCQCRPVWTPSGYTMVRVPGKGFTKDSCTLCNVRTKTAFRKYLYGRGMCGIAATSGIPVYQEMYKLMLRSGYTSGKISEDTAFEDGLWWLSRGMCPVERPVHPLTRVSYWEAFGVAPHEQRALERGFMSRHNLTYAKPIPVNDLLKLETFGHPQASLIE